MSVDGNNTVDLQAFQLKTLLQDKPWNMPLKTGELAPKGFNFAFEPNMPEVSDFFKPFVREQAYDCGELAIVSYLQARSFNKPLVLLPFAVSGSFHNKSIAYNSQYGTVTPANLAGKRVGVRSYAQTTGVWVRGILQHEHGVDLKKVTWVTFQDAHLVEYHDPSNCIRAPKGKKLVEMLMSGEVDAGMLGGNMPKDPNLKTVIPDAEEDAKRWAQKYGVTPINHMFVVTKELCRTRPEVVRELYQLLLSTRKGGSPYPSGLDGNWKALELAAEYAFEQEIIPRRFTVAEMFADAKEVLNS